VTQCFVFKTFIPENKMSQQYVVLNTEMSCALVISGLLHSGTCRQKATVKWH